MRQLTPADLRFHLWFSLKLLPKGILRDMASTGPKRDRAMEIATDMMVERFARHEVFAQDPVKAH